MTQTAAGEPRTAIVIGVGADAFIDLAGLTDACWTLYRQPPRAWTFELDVRTQAERW